MKICLSCRKEIFSKRWLCIHCGWSPKGIKGLIQFSPGKENSKIGYDPKWHKELSELETGNFWFENRNEFIRWVSKKYLSSKSRYLEIGCGTGFVLTMLRRNFPRWNFSASEMESTGISYAMQRLPKKVNFFQMDACAIPFLSEFDVIGAFDVLEHIPNDLKAISNIYNALKPNGFFVLTVPQHMFLWSQFDEIGCHFRRYSKEDIEVKLHSQGFKIIYSNSFNTLLLPLMFLSRLLNKNNKSLDVLDELKISKIINFCLSAILKFELGLIKLGIKFPIGGSRFIIARKAL
jgi:SAM-dependent methyltransferase